MVDNMQLPGSSFQYMEEALPFVLFNPKTNKFEVNEETRDFLRTLPSPIGVISVAGMYRSGKSYLLNRVLLNRSRGFDVGHTINACTKGVWIWGKPVDGFTPEGDPIKILVLDTEGLGATDEEQNHDVRIFSLAILLASFFIYNSQQSIDETKLNDLSLVINLTKNIQIKAGGGNDDTDPEEYAQYFPALMWVVRDFTLQLVDQEQEPITSKEYLEKALQNQKGFSEAIDKKNRIRRLLKSFFKERDCCTMIRPLTKEDMLQNLADIPLENLRPEFVEQVHGLRRKVMNRVKPKQLNSKPLNGDMLFNLAKSYAEAINLGAVPSIESSWSYICKNECQKALLESLQTFEQRFYQEFSENCPMPQEELKQIYKEVKKEAMLSFKKAAVGEVKEQFINQMKSQMAQKFELFSMENEKTSDQECTNFLQRNYNSIAQKLNNDEYDSLESLNYEILGFLNYFVEEGPKGPNSQQIAQQFCYDRLAEGSTFFSEKLARQLYVNSQLADQQVSKLKSDLSEIKDEKRKELEQIQTKLRLSEQQRAEFAAREETIRETLLQCQKEKERVEQESEEKIMNNKREAQRLIQEMTDKMNESIERQKEVARIQKNNESEFDKQKALYVQQIEHLTQKTGQQEEKERQLIHELKEQKLEAHNSSKEAINKYETEIRELSAKVKEYAEQIYELESQSKDEEQRVALITQEWTAKEQKLITELQMLKEQKEELTNQNKTLRSKYDEEMFSKNEEKEAEMSRNTERIQELEEYVKELEDQNESIKSQSIKDQAVQKQKLEFAQLQLEQEIKLKQEQKESHERILRSFRDNERMSVIGKEEAKSQLANLAQQHQDELQQLHDNYTTKETERENVISTLTENLSKAKMEMTLQFEDFKREIENLRENLQITEEERDKFQSLSEKQLSMHERKLEESNSRMQDKIRELEDQLEEKETQLQVTINEIDSNSQQQLDKLKKFYEGEKSRYEKRIQDIKEQANKSLTETELDYKNQLLFLQEESEEVQRSLNDEVQHLSEQLQQAVTQRDGQIALLTQQLEAYDKQLIEKTEALDKMAEQHQVKLDQQYEMYNQERKSLAEKNENQVSKIAQLERQKITLENGVDSLKNSIAMKEKLLAELKEEMDSEKANLTLKYKDLKEKFDRKEDDLNSKNISFEKDQALYQQQIKFAEAKAAEMQLQYDSTVKRYEERIKMDKEEMQREIKDRSQRLLEEKEAAEAKYQAKRKELKDVEKRLINKTSESETERAVLNQKFANLEQEREKLIITYENEINNLRNSNEVLSKNFEDAKMSNAYNYEQVRLQLEQTQTELQEQKNLLDKERALWEGKFQFLETQRDQSKQDYEELQNKLQQSLDLQQKMHFDSKSNAEASHNQLIQQIDQKYNMRLKEMSERQNAERLELNGRIKNLEREKAHLSERLEVSIRDQSSEQSNLSKRYEKEKELNERLSEELETVKNDRDRKIMDFQNKLDKERENFNARKRDIENRAARAESKQTQLLLGHESEKATWDTKMTEMRHQIDEYKSKVDRLQANLEQKEQQIGRLMQENKQARRNYMTASKNTENAMSAAVGSSIMGKLNLQGLGAGKGPGAGVGFQPKMYGQAKMGGEGEGSDTQRSFASRFTPAVSASMDISQNKFAFGNKPNFLGMNNFNRGGDDDTTSQRSYQFMTPNSRGGMISRKSELEEADAPNTDEFNLGDK